MKVQAIKGRKIDGTYNGYSYIAHRWGAIHGDYIGVGFTASEAINNCLVEIVKQKMN